jgi:NDP-sugar pyrophosphorylase family protein
MNASIPKALVPITDQPCLTTTLQQVGSKFDRVFVVVNTIVEHQWKKYAETLHPDLSKNVFFVPINSGLGDGHAVLWGFAGARSLKDERLSKQFENQAFDQLNDDIVIMWGDVFVQYAELFDELLSKSITRSGILPAVLEKDPYVTLLVDDHMNCISADFSKYGEKHPTGFHDQSVFRFSRSILWSALRSIHAAFWKGGRYITPGGELSLLHAFHYLYNCNSAAHVYETSYPTLSFNTPEEVAAIQREINSSWSAKNRS